MIFPTDHSYIADLPGSKAEPDAHDDKIQWLGHCTKGDFFSKPSTVKKIWKPQETPASERDVP
jgi:hypothetical protein